jgi:hypothetical protein
MRTTLRIELLDGFVVTTDERSVPAGAWLRSKAARLVKLLASAPAHRPGLARDLQVPERSVSFGDWEGVDRVRDWKSSPECREPMARVQYVDEFRPTELALVANAERGSISTRARVEVA